MVTIFYSSPSHRATDKIGRHNFNASFFGHVGGYHTQGSYKTKESFDSMRFLSTYEAQAARIAICGSDNVFDFIGVGISV